LKKILNGGEKEKSGGEGGEKRAETIRKKLKRGDKHEKGGNFQF